MPIQKFPTDIPKYYAYEQVAGLYLTSALNFAVEAILDNVAAEKFGEKLRRIEPPDEILSFIQEKEFITVDTILAMLEGSPQIEEAGNAWAESLAESRQDPKPIGKSEILYSVDLAGHLVMLGAFMELTLNAALETQVDRCELDIELWKAIERWDIVQKTLFLFNAEVKNNLVHIDGMRRLQSLRNKFVHFKSLNYGAHELTVAELLTIWSQLSEILGLTKRYLPDSGFDEAIAHLKSQFISE